MLASGPRAATANDLIAEVIGPVWESNHVWLILVVVLLFTCFPCRPSPPSATVMLHHSHITLALVGIVLRGAAFTFRAYDSQHSAVQRRWSRIFSLASLITPVLLGMIVGTIAAERVNPDEMHVLSDYLTIWLGVFQLAVGLFTLALFAFLAAVYLTVESRGSALAEDFRLRALNCRRGRRVLALAVFVRLSASAAPKVHAGITAPRSSPLPLHGATALCALGAFYTLWTRRYTIGRACWPPHKSA